MSALAANTITSNCTPGKKIAIIGAGFSGTLVLANLVKLTTQPLCIEWFDAYARFGQGNAYSTKFKEHLLNVATIKMGAYAKEADGFWQWLQTPKGQAEAEHFVSPNKITPQSFLPRALYARYLNSILDNTLDLAKQKNITINKHAMHVIDVTRLNQTQLFTIHAENKAKEQALQIQVDKIVLATGNLKASGHAVLNKADLPNTRYIKNIWGCFSNETLRKQVGDYSEDDTILIIGTGLTMVDLVLSLKALEYKGNIVALSRDGLMPQSHQDYKEYPSWAWRENASNAPASLTKKLIRLRQEFKHAIKNGYDWRSVVDSLRPITVALWQQLSSQERKRFFKRLFTFWNIHRHRMAPEIYQQLITMQTASKLKVMSGIIKNVEHDKQNLIIHYHKPRSTDSTITNPTLIFDCTGPNYNIISGDELFQNLISKQLVELSNTGVGVKIDSTHSATGKAQSNLYPIGSLLLGEQLECTAVPELREQAGHIAEQILLHTKQDADYLT